MHGLLQEIEKPHLVSNMPYCRSTTAMPNDPIRNRAAEQVKVTIVIDTEAPPYKVHSFVQENLPLLILI